MTSNLLSGLIIRRGELYREMQSVRDREAELWLDMNALDRTLRGLGFEGDLEAVMPRKRYDMTYKREELSKARMTALRESGGLLTTRQIAEAVLAARGEEMGQVRMNVFAKACAQSMGNMAAQGRLTKGEDANGNVVWSTKILARIDSNKKLTGRKANQQD